MVDSILTKHFLNCPAPVCADDPNPEFMKEILWIPGEIVCGKKPLRKFQKKQLIINRELNKGTFKKWDEAFNAYSLEHASI